jgi:dihydroorotase|tara:strand:+ start:546 stop:1760 length:1215 start_codon:yes stop_codon:yes gene_type:complete
MDNNITYDLLITNGRIVDIASNMNQVSNIAILDGKIALINDEIGGIQYRRKIDAYGNIITAGLIDLHTHVAGGLRKIHQEDLMRSADSGGVNSGITTVLDAGSTGAYNVGAFVNEVVANSKTNVFALLNIGTMGIMRIPEVRSLADIDSKGTVEAIISRPDVLKGVKLRMVSPAIQELGSDLVSCAKAVSSASNSLLMVHVGDITGKSNEAVKLAPFLLSRVLEHGDIVTHSFSHQPGGLLSNGRPLDETFEAKKKGVIFDIGVGVANFSFDSAKIMLDSGFIPDTLSSDITLAGLYDGPVFSLFDAMGKIMSLGLSLTDIVKMTTLAPAKALGMENEIGSLQIGRKADISIFELIEGQFIFHDVTGATNNGNVAIRPKLAIKNGDVMPLDFGPRPWGWLPNQE